MVPNQFFKWTGLAGIGVLALSGVSYFYWDQRLSLYFSDERLSAFREFNRWITDFGLADYYFGTIILAYLLSRMFISWFQFDQLGSWSLKLIRQESVFALQCLLLSGLVIHLIKALVGRQRPHLTADFDSTIFKPFTLHWHWHSFPSGHSQVIFVSLLCWEFGTLDGKKCFGFLPLWWLFQESPLISIF